MAGFKFEIGIKKGLRVSKDLVQMADKEDLLQEWGEVVQAKARANSRRRTGGDDWAKGRRSGKMEASIKVSNSEKSASGLTVSRRVYVDEAMTKTASGPYARFQEFGTGWHTHYPGTARHMIVPRRGRYMTWIEHSAKPYRGEFVKARLVSNIQTKNLKRPRLLQKRHGGPAHSKYQRTYNQRQSGGPWLQSAEQVKGVLPRWFMRDAADFARRGGDFDKVYQRARRQIMAGVERNLFLDA